MVAVDGADLPLWTAGAHLNIVVAPEFLRQYSMCGDPSDRSCYEIAVLLESEGRGGSKLMQRIFERGRRLFVSKPINHFALEPSASLSLLFGAGIGVTPMIAFAHELDSVGRNFKLRYSVSTQASAAFDSDLDAQPWAKKCSKHYSDQGSRLNITAVVPSYEAGIHIYVCGPNVYMNAILDHARFMGYPDEVLHAELFAVPDMPDWINFPFEIECRNGQKVAVSVDQSASDALIAAGISVDVKCSDGLCGVCRCTLISGEVEHRDFVLSARQREHTMILCQSRALQKNAVLKLGI